MGECSTNTRRVLLVMLTGATGALLLSLAGPKPSCAAGTKYQVDAEPGDMVVQRTVSARPAARPMPPGKALMLEMGPEREIRSGLGALELTDAEYAGVSSGRAGASPASNGLVGAEVRNSLRQMSGSLNGPAGQAGTAGIAGSVRAATGGIDRTVKDALAGSGLLPMGGQR